MLYKRNYRHFGYDTADHTKWNARDVFHLFSGFDYTVFGHTKFLIKDDSLFKRKTDSSYVQLTLLPNPSNGKISSMSYLECETFMYCDIVLGNGMVRTASGADCWNIDICTLYSGGGGGGGDTGSGDTGGGWTGTGNGTGDSGSGGGGSGDGWYGGGGDPNPCGPPAPLRTTSIAPDCGGWTPVDNNYPDFQLIIDSLTSPCLKNTLNNLLINNYTSQISNMLNTIWGSTLDCNVRFLQTDTLPTDVDARTRTTIAQGIMTHRIRLNQPILDSASIEYVAAIMFHEILHAYLNATGVYGNTVTHNAIANQYVNMLSSSLSAHFPNLDPIDIKALAWGGLQDTQAWDSIKVNHPAEYIDLKARNARHRVHTSGTICQ